MFETIARVRGTANRQSVVTANGPCASDADRGYMLLNSRGLASHTLVKVECSFTVFKAKSVGQPLQAPMQHNAR